MAASVTSGSFGLSWVCVLVWLLASLNYVSFGVSWGCVAVWLPALLPFIWPFLGECSGAAARVTPSVPFLYFLGECSGVAASVTSVPLDLS